MPNKHLGVPYNRDFLEAVIAQMPFGLGVMDHNGHWVLTNALMRFYSDEIMPTHDNGHSNHHNWHAVLPNGQKLDPEAWPSARALRGETVSPGVDFKFSTDGHTMTVRVAAAPCHGDDNFHGAVVAIQDLTEFEQKQYTIIQELQHRTNNMLAVVQGLAKVSDDRATLEARIQALAYANRQLVAENWQGARVRTLLSQTLHAFPSRIVLDGDNEMLKPNDVQNFTLAIHELMTNAIKYGALSVPNGMVIIRWRQADDQLSFRWQERDGPSVQKPTRTGFGSQLLKHVFANASIEYRADGMVCCFTIKSGGGHRRLDDLYARPEKHHDQT